MSDERRASAPNPHLRTRPATMITAIGLCIVVMLMPTSSDALAMEMAHVKPSADLRDYGIGAQILADLGVNDMVLLTNSHQNVVAIAGHGLSIVGEQPIP